MELEELLTKKDLAAFKDTLLRDIVEVLRNNGGQQKKVYLRTKDVKQILGISNNTLQMLRVKKLLCPCSKVEGIYYYKWQDIEKLLNASTEL